MILSKFISNLVALMCEEHIFCAFFITIMVIK